MHRFIYLLFIPFTSLLFSQSESLAVNYFEKGDFEKAKISFQKLYTDNPYNQKYFDYLIKSFQQLEAYRTVDSLLVTKIESNAFSPRLWVLRGYNFQLQNDTEKAEEAYTKAVKTIKENPFYGRLLGDAFQQINQLDWAIKAYKKAMELNPKLDYHINLARVYGEKGDIAYMYDNYLSLLIKNKAYKQAILGNISSFITENPENPNNILLRKRILSKMQQQPNPILNASMAWLFIQQRQYLKAFIQERAVYLKSKNLNPLIRLAKIAKEENHSGTQEILDFIIKNSSNKAIKIWAHKQAIALKLEANRPNIDKVEKEFKQLFETYKTGLETTDLQIMYAEFLVFYKSEIQQGILLLKTLIQKPLPKFQLAKAKMALADILVFDEKFSQALIYYSQIQKAFKNDVLGQQARFKVAQTSYYKGDFKWAETQLNVLKSSSSQLIANDALKLKLLISDNVFQDTILVALKKYAKADLLAYQNKNEEAIALLEEILQHHKGKTIEDEALLKQANLYIKSGNYEKARFNYQKIIEFYGDGILADDAHYQLAKLYEEFLDQIPLAKKHYEYLIFNKPDSVFFVEARNRYRKLRGDDAFNP